MDNEVSTARFIIYYPLLIVHYPLNHEHNSCYHCRYGHYQRHGLE